MVVQIAHVVGDIEKEISRGAVGITDITKTVVTRHPVVVGQGCERIARADLGCGDGAGDIADAGFIHRRRPAWNADKITWRGDWFETAALQDEPWNQTVESHAVIIAAVHISHEVGHGARCQAWV